MTVTATTGYDPKTFTVGSVSYTTDMDPFNEYQWALLQLQAYIDGIKAEAGNSPLGGVTAPGGGAWTYNPNTGNYTLSGNGTNTLEVTVNEADHTFKIISSKFGERVWSKSTSVSTASLAPLSSGLKGNLKVVFAVQHDANGALNDVMTQAVAKDGVQLWAREVTSNVGVTPVTYGSTTYGPVTVGVGPGVVPNAGEFLFDKILPANTRMRLFANPFSQETTATPKVTYYFSGAADSDSTQAYVNIGDFTTVHNVTTDATKSTAMFPAIYAYDDKAIIVGHSVGSVNINNRLAANGSFTVTFNKPIDASSFVAYVDASTAGAYGEENDNGIWETGEDVALTAVWDTAGTTVTLTPRDKVGNPYDGVYPYGLNGSPLVIAVGARAQDGTGVAYAALSPTNPLQLYTEKGINLVAVEYLDSAGAVAPQILGNLSGLPFGGSVRLTFDKALDTRLALQDVQLYKWATQPTLPTVTPAASDWVAKPTITIAPATPTVMTLSFGTALAFKDYYTLQLKTVSSAQVNDKVSNKFLGFRSNHSINLTKVDLYRNATNVYYTEKPDDTVAYFPVKNDINLTFGTALTGVTAKVELYKASEIATPSTADALLKKQIATVNTIAGQVLTINPGVNLELNTKYALAVKLYDASGTVLFSSQSNEFFNENGVDSTLFSKTNLVDTTKYDAVVGGNSHYITFTTEETLALRDLTVNAYPKAIVTNVKIPTVTSTPLTTNFKATDPIVLEFNKPLAALGATDVLLYYWRDAGTIGTVETDELTQTPATVTLGTAPNDNIVAITPSGTLAPGLKFAIKAVVTSLSDSLDRLTYDTLAPAPGPLGSPYPATKPSLSFIVNSTTLVDLGATPAAANLISNFAVNTKPTGQTYTGVDSAQAGVTLKWDLLKDLPGEASYYKVYEQTPVDTSWKTTPVTTVAEKNWYETLYMTQLDDAVAPLTDVIPGGTMQSYLLNSGAIKYMVQAYTKTGLLKQSATLSVTDTVGPQFIGTTNLSTPTTGAWGTLVYVNNTLPTKDTYTNGPGAPLVLTYDFTNTNQELITSYTVSPSFVNTGVVATTAYNAARNGITVTLTIAPSAVINGGEGFTVTMTDSSGKAAVVNWAATTPVTSVNTIIADTP